VFEGIYNHTDNLDKRLDFLEFIVTKFDDGNLFGKEKLTELWEVFITKANFGFEKSIFLKWLNKEKHYEDIEAWKMFSSEERHFLFEDILSKPVYISPEEISEDEFKTF
jgi:hypothetical protein